MMKSTYLSKSMLPIMFLSLFACADVDCTTKMECPTVPQQVTGVLHLEKCTVTELEAYGELNVIDVVAKGNANVFGHLGANLLTVEGSMTINGQADLYESKIQKTTIVFGYLRAEKSNFEDIKVGSEKLTLVNSIVNKSIHVGKPSNGRKQIIVVTGGEVKGDITFDGGNGEVILEKGALIRGKIKGAELHIK